MATKTPTPVSASDFFGKDVQVNTPPAQAPQSVQADQFFNPSVQAMDKKLKGGILGKVGGLFTNLQDTIKKGMEEHSQAVGDIATRTIRGQETLPEAALGVAGQTIKGVFDTGTNILGDLIPSWVTEPAKKQFAESPIVKALSPGLQRIAQNEEEGQVEKTIGSLADSLFKWTQDHPRAARNLENAFQVASVIPAEKAAGVAGEAALKGVDEALAAGKAAGREVAPVLGESMGKAARLLEKGAEVRDLDKALEITSPVLNKAQREAAVAEGRISESAFGTKALPSSKDKEVAESVVGLVNTGPLGGINAKNNIDAIRNHIAVASENLTQALKDRGMIFNNREISRYFKDAKEGSRVIFGSDKTLEKTYDAVKDEFMRILKTHGNTLDGVMDARKEFDKVIESKFPGLLGNPAGDNVRRNAILDVRRAANNFVMDKLPAGDAGRDVLRRITNQYSAIENIAEKAASSLNMNALSKALDAVKSNPLLAAGTALGVGSAGASMVGLLSNPVVISALALTGAYKAGKMLLTSDMVTQFLINALRTGEKALNPEGKRAIAELLDILGSSEVPAIPGASQ